MNYRRVDVVSDLDDFGRLSATTSCAKDLDQQHDQTMRKLGKGTGETELLPSNRRLKSPTVAAAKIARTRKTK